MPDKKPTDAEIVKALEYAKEMEMEDVVICYEDVCTLLDIINRLQAEKQNLEIELKAMRGSANSYKAEVERLKTEKDNLIRTYAECQAEAVKEFADRLHDEVFIMSRTPEGDIDFNDFEVLLRKIQKETVGDAK